MGFILRSSLTLIWLSGFGSERVKLSNLQLERAVMFFLQKEGITIQTVENESKADIDLFLSN